MLGASLVAAVDSTAQDKPPVAADSKLYTVVDGLVDGFFPRLSAIDDRIDVLEEGIFRKAGEEDLQEIFAMKRELVAIRKVISRLRSHCSSWGVEGSAPYSRSKAPWSSKPARTYPM